MSKQLDEAREELLQALAAGPNLVPMYAAQSIAASLVGILECMERLADAWGKSETAPDLDFLDDSQKPA